MPRQPIMIFILLIHLIKLTTATDAFSLIIELKMVLMPAMLLYMDITWVLVLCLVLLPDIRILVSTRRKVMMFFIYNFSNLSGLREYAKNVQAESLYNTGVDISNATQVVTFSTCTDDSKQRVIVSGTYVGESKLDNGTSSEASASASE